MALGLVLTYRASGVINFAHAAIGMYIAFAYYELRGTGDLVLPVLGLPARIHVMDDPPTWVAFAVAILLAAAIGVFLYAAVFRPLRHAPLLGRVVASLGIFLYVQSLVSLRFPTSGAAVSTIEPLFPTEPVTILGAVIPRDRIWLAIVVMLTAVALAAAYRWTRFGIATRAASESEKGALLIGLSPDRVAVVNWVLATVSAGVAMILIAPIARLDPVTSSLLVVPALAAALLGGFRSFLIAGGAGLAIGMLQSELLKLQADHGWLPDGVQQGVPFLLVILVMALRGRSLPTRGDLIQRLMPRSPTPRHAGVATLVLAAGAIVGLLTLGSVWRSGIITTTIATLLCLSIVVLTGYVGQISLAPMAFAGFGGFAVIKFTEAYGIPFPVAPLLAAAAAVALGLLTGLPAVRVRGMSLALVTLAAALAVEEIVFRWGWLTGGFGGTDVPPPEFFGVDLGIAARGTDFPRPAFGILCVVVTALAGLLVANYRRSTTGLRFLAVRANERAAAASGIDVARTKLTAFAVSSFLAGLAGCLLAYQRQTISGDSFLVFLSLSFLALTYLGGIAGVSGAVIAGLLAQGGLLTVALDQTGGDAAEYQFAISGVALVAVAVAYPEGISGAVRSGWKRLAQRSRPAPPDPAPAGAGTMAA